MGSICYRTCLAVAVCAAVVSLSSVSARADEPVPAPRTISVTGRGEVSVAPDVAVLTLAVETTAATAEEATSANARKSQAVLEAVKRLVTSEDSVQTTGYTLQPQYGDRRPGSQTPPSIVGYVARHSVRVESHDLENVGKVLDAALQAGANRSTSLGFQLEKKDAPLRAALALAGAEARAQAESIAKALGVRLGDVLSASTSAPPMPSYREQSVMTMRAAVESVATPVEVGELTIEATLHVTYAID